VSAPDERPPGVREHPQRVVPRWHWELLACGLRGHALEGTDARRLRPQDAVFAHDAGGVRWHRCLRCDSWLPLPPPAAPVREVPPDRDAIELPLRGRPLRDRIVLRAIAVNRALHFVALALLAGAILVFSANRADLHHAVTRVLADLGAGTARGGGAHHGVAAEVDKLFTLNSSRLHLFAAIALVYAAIEGVEAIGLWYARRWAEYLTFLVTASLLPVEVYELSHRLSPLKITAFVLNVAVVAYLLYAKRLFGVRGGVAAEQRLREEEVGWPALEAGLPGRAAHPSG
jgi:uncharacterized membrane protein (DUF2068 family)